MGWTVLYIAVLVFASATMWLLNRRSELRKMAQTIADIDDAKARGSDKAPLQFPHVDLEKCIGCGTCIAACPEEGVLQLVHGQAAVVHGSRCVGHGLCADACGVSAIAVKLGDVSDRKDLPALSEAFEVIGQKGLFLAGEVTGQALIRSAIIQGQGIAEMVARRVKSQAQQPTSAARPAMATAQVAATPSRFAIDSATEQSEKILDLCIIGAGPAGLSCALQAKQDGIDALIIEREAELGGTVAKYPRRKLVMTQPVNLPLHGRLKRSSYQKEELVEIWGKLVTKYQLPAKTGHEFLGLQRDEQGIFTVETSGGSFRARYVCLSVGRRGTPRKLGVPGEDLPKVTYSLLDAQSYQGRKILVVGGGDSAIEAATGLAEQPGNQVTLSYRKSAFFRLKAKNERRLDEAVANGDLTLILNSQVIAVSETRASLKIDHGDAGNEERELDNDEVFVFAGGIPPFKLLEKCGVSFRPEDRPVPPPKEASNAGLFRAMVVATIISCGTLLWLLVFQSYYNTPLTLRPASPMHDLLRPGGPLGIGLGFSAAALILVNLCYLLRRSRIGQRIAGSLQDWLSYHMATGFLALALVVIHAAAAPRNTPGGHAFYALFVLLVTGLIGRYFYAFVPKAAAGRTLALKEVQAKLAAISSEWDREGSGFGERVRAQVDNLVRSENWEKSFISRVLALLCNRRKLRVTIAELRIEGSREGLPESQVESMVSLTRRIHRAALISAHYEDLRGLLATWRFLHRWVALVMVLLACVHIWTALRFSQIFR